MARAPSLEALRRAAPEELAAQLRAHSAWPAEALATAVHRLASARAARQWRAVYPNVGPSVRRTFPKDAAARTVAITAYAFAQLRARSADLDFFCGLAEFSLSSLTISSESVGRT